VVFLLEVFFEAPVVTTLPVAVLRRGFFAAVLRFFPALL
jgi:hypothetical protein